MKISKIAAMCRKARQVVRYAGSPDGGQWIGTRWAAFSIGGLPALDAAGLKTLFEFSDKEWDDTDVVTDTLGMLDLSPLDTEAGADAEALPFALSFPSRTLSGLYTPDGLVLYESRLLAPVADEAAALHVRKDVAGRPWIVAMDGFMPRGFCATHETVTEEFAAASARFAEAVARIAEAASSVRPEPRLPYKD